MPIEVELPDGTIAEFPDGTATEAMESALRSYRKSSDFTGVTARTDTTGQSPFGGVTTHVDQTNNDASFDEQNKRGLGLAARMGAQGLAGLGDFAVQLATRGPQGAALLRANGVPVPQPYQATSEALTNAGVPTYDTPGERILGRVGEAVTGTAATMGLGAVAAPGSILTAAPGVQLASAASGGASGGIAREMGASPGAELAATVLGGLAPGVGGAMTARVPAGQMGRQMDASAAQGIPLRPSAVSDSTILAKARSLPGGGSAARYSADVQKVNARLGEILGAPGVDPDQVYPVAMARAGNEFNTIAQTYPFQMTPSAIRKMVNYRNTADRIGGAESPTVRAIDEFLNEAIQAPGGKVSGELFKKLDTELGAVPYDKVSNRDLRSFITSMRDEYKATMPKADANLFDDLMRRYGDLKKVEPLYAKMAGKPIDPQALMAAVTRKGSDKKVMASGREGELGRLARTGKNISPPGPGMTPGMGIVPAAMYGAASLGGPVLGRIADSPYLARYLASSPAPGRGANNLWAATIGTANADNSRKKDKK